MWRDGGDCPGATVRGAIVRGCLSGRWMSGGAIFRTPYSITVGRKVL